MEIYNQEQFDTKYDTHQLQKAGTFPNLGFNASYTKYISKDETTSDYEKLWKSYGKTRILYIWRVELFLQS